MDNNDDDATPNEQQQTVLSLKGSFNGYLTVQEMYDFMGQIGRDLNPFSLGPLEIGRSTDEKYVIKALCIGQCHSCAPATLYTALHHGREPMSMMTLAYTLRDIRDRFKAGNLEVTSLLEARQLWFIPIVNPSGYSKNVDTGKISKSKYRKNTRETCINEPKKNGVDINRNYDYCFLGTTTSKNCDGDSKDHGGSSNSNKNNNNGNDSSEGGVCHGSSSNDGCAEKYRGKKPFSESETLAVRDFVYTHNISNALNYHSYGGNLFWPFSCPHHSEERRLKWVASLINIHQIGKELAELNKYRTGNVVDILQYSAAGDASDWMYGEEGIVALTPETGPTDEEAVEGELDVDLGGLYGFYPPPDKIEEYADVNTEANIRMAWFAGALYRAQVTQYKATQVTMRQEQIKQYNIEISLRNVGLKTNVNRIMVALSAQEKNLMGYHRILKVNELSSSSSSISILKNNASVFTTFQINDKDLDETGGLNTQLYIAVADSETCTLFAISNDGSMRKNIIGTSHLRPCDLCESFYRYEGFFSLDNTTLATSKGFQNVSLPIKHVEIINNKEYCNLKSEDLSRCSGKGIPVDNSWQLYLAVSLIGFIFLFGLGFLFVKFRVFSRCKEERRRRRNGFKKDDFGNGTKKKKYKDMTEVYDVNSSDIHIDDDEIVAKKEKYKDWDIENLEDVDDDAVVRLEMSSMRHMNPGFL